MRWSDALRGRLYLGYAHWRGYRFPGLYRCFQEEKGGGSLGDTTGRALSYLLLHCRESVPYYSRLLWDSPLSEIEARPFAVLARLPLLTKDLIRDHFQELQALDVDRRGPYFNTSGGSTGEPVRFVQDAEYRDRTAALAMLQASAVGYRPGEPQVHLWGSERDVLEGSIGWKAMFFNALTNTTLLNSFRMTPARMEDFLSTLERIRPRLVIAYAQSIYELACFAESKGRTVGPLHAIITSAGTLFPFMRTKIQSVFQCPVYNRYGSREVGPIACEEPGRSGLWVLPWGNHLEVLDPDGRPAPAGAPGSIVVTSLTNLSMPLLRYFIGDRGALSAQTSPGEQVLESVAGRTVDTFRTADGTLIDGEYFTHLLYFRSWVRRFQVVQKSHAEIVIRVEGESSCAPAEERKEIAEGCRAVMGDRCRIDFEFLAELPPLDSGKFRYTVSEVP